MYVFISSWCNVETLIKSEMIFVNPVVKCCECAQNWSIEVVGDIRKDILKDKKEKLGRIN